MPRRTAAHPIGYDARVQTILGPNIAADFFGPGLNAFRAQDPMLGPPTAVTTEYLNNVLMEIINVIIGQGIDLDSAQFDQLKKAIDDYTFADPHVSGSLTIDGGAMLFVENLGTIDVQAGAGLVLKNGSTLAFEANVTLVAADQSWTWGTSNANFWTINGDIRLGTDATNLLLVKSPSTFEQNVTLSSGASVDGAMVVSGADGGSVTSDGLAVLDWNGQILASGRLTIAGSLSIVPGDLSVDGSSNLRYRDAAATKYVHVNASGWVKGHGDTSTAGPSATINVDTDTAVAPIVASDMDIEARASVSRVGGGTVQLTLTEVGVGPIGASRSRVVVSTAADSYTEVSISRTHAASTTPRIYRLTVDGLGANVSLVEARITATPAS
jgi:hypothetical protein